MEKTPEELHSVADNIPPLSERESEVMGRQTEGHRPGQKLEDETVYGETDYGPETEDQADAHNAEYTDLP
jgi:hypothetical protein